jgi:hypothetical protein
VTDELKKVLAIAVPVGFLLVSAMVIYGPGAKIEGAGARLAGARSRARRRKEPRARRRREVARTMRQIDRLPRADESEAAWLARTQFHGTDEDLSMLTPSEINRRLDRLDKLSSKLTDEFIAAGRGHELPSETFKKTDPLAERKRRVWADSDALHREISRRYGPGAPSRMPTRGRR